MNFLQRLENWGTNHHPKWMNIVRIALGIGQWKISKVISYDH